MQVCGQRLALTPRHYKHMLVHGRTLSLTPVSTLTQTLEDVKNSVLTLTLTEIGF